jgi:hypothetical protein
LKNTIRFGALLAVLLATTPARAAEWSDNSFHLTYGSQFREPANPNDISKMIFTFNHVSGYKYGGNFLNVDLLYSLNNASGKDTLNGLNAVPSAGAAEVYIVYRHTLSLNKVTNSKTFQLGGIVRDIGIDAGTDLNTKNSAFSSRKIMPVLGVSAAFNVPGFLNFGVLINKEWGVNAIIGKEVSFDASPIINAAWGIPVYGPLSFEGWGAVIFPKGKDAFGADTVTEVHLRPKLMVDVGTFFGGKGFQVGVGYEYWLNKFGNDHSKDTSGGSLAQTFFVEGAIHL